MITPADFYEKLIEWALSSGIRILVILIIAVIINRFGRLFIKRIVRKAINDPNEETEKKREDTLISIFSSSFRFMIWVIAVATILPELGISIGPVLAGAGLIGLAVGMGARSLIADYLAGVFIVFEDQYRVGDTIEIAKLEGTVKEITLRRTILQDSEGVIHTVPNGEIKISSNKSR